jgi:hypothetical protein
MHIDRAPQLTIVELIDALEAKIAAMRRRHNTLARPETREIAARWEVLWAPRADVEPRTKRTHPFSNIEDL